MEVETKEAGQGSGPDDAWYVTFNDHKNYELMTVSRITSGNAPAGVGVLQDQIQDITNEIRIAGEGTFAEPWNVVFPGYANVIPITVTKIANDVNLSESVEEFDNLEHAVVDETEALPPRGEAGGQIEVTGPLTGPGTSQLDPWIITFPGTQNYELLEVNAITSGALSVFTQVVGVFTDVSDPPPIIRGIDVLDGVRAVETQTVALVIPAAVDEVGMAFQFKLQLTTVTGGVIGTTEFIDYDKAAIPAASVIEQKLDDIVGFDAGFTVRSLAGPVPAWRIVYPATGGDFGEIQVIYPNVSPDIQTAQDGNATTKEIQTVALSPDQLVPNVAVASFKLSFIDAAGTSYETGPISNTALPADVALAINTAVGSTAVAVTGTGTPGDDPWRVEFQVPQDYSLMQAELTSSATLSSDVEDISQQVIVNGDGSTPSTPWDVEFPGYQDYALLEVNDITSINPLVSPQLAAPFVDLNPDLLHAFVDLTEALTPRGEAGGQIEVTGPLTGPGTLPSDPWIITFPGTQDYELLEVNAITSADVSVLTPLVGVFTDVSDPPPITRGIDVLDGVRPVETQKLALVIPDEIKNSGMEFDFQLAVADVNDNEIVRTDFIRYKTDMVPSAGDIEEKLNQMAAFDAGFTVTGTGIVADPWRIIYPASGGDYGEIQVIYPDLQLEVQTTQPGDGTAVREIQSLALVPDQQNPPLGYFTLRLTDAAGTEYVTNPLVNTASGADIAVAINNAVGDTRVAVTGGAGTSIDPWIIEFQDFQDYTPLQFNWVTSAPTLDTQFEDISQKVVVTGDAIETQTLWIQVPDGTVVGEPDYSGSSFDFKLTIRDLFGVTYTTSDISYPVSNPQVIADALDLISGPGGEQVADGFQVTGAGTPSDPWQIVFPAGETRYFEKVKVLFPDAQFFIEEPDPAVNPEVQELYFLNSSGQRTEYQLTVKWTDGLGAQQATTQWLDTSATAPVLAQELQNLNLTSDDAFTVTGSGTSAVDPFVIDFGGTEVYELSVVTLVSTTVGLTTSHYHVDDITAAGEGTASSPWVIEFPGYHLFRPPCLLRSWT
jgi:hypothetical protein